ncbi:MAG TPA: sulfotransferase [Rhizomicrobium sp.]|jgi:tetratricopeptide (TPR) repeat protein
MNDSERLLSARKSYEAAVTLHRQDNLAEAERHYLAVKKLYPTHPGALHGLGLISLRNANYEKAAGYLQQARISAPSNHAIRCDLGNAYLNLALYEDALDCFEAVLATAPDNPAALAGVGAALNILGRTSEAQTVFEKLLALDSKNALGHFGLGNVMAQLGRTADARRAFERALALSPKQAAYHRALADIERFAENDPRLTALDALAQREDKLADGQKAELHFALAKANDDLKRHSTAFAHLEKGNSIKRRLVSYNEAEMAEAFGALRAVFTPEVMQRETGDPSGLPIFVVGMPRSGTTLVEQILASDSIVVGAGELTIVQKLIAGGRAGKSYPNDASKLSDAALRRFGADYVKALSALAPGASRVIDKLPGNFLHIGLIHLALPNARIIHVRRDPMDTCFSCYSKLFLNGLNYSYDLGELGRYYRMYDTLMTHWRAVLPEGAMLDVQYETLVGDFANEARRMVEYCGLEWSERFLSFHKNDRPVRTHSQAQVRQPLFNSSIGRWRSYEAWLKPLRDVLDGLA